MVLDDIDDLLTTGGITTTIYHGRLVDRPNDAFSIDEQGGVAPVRGMASGPGQALFERVNISLVRRSTSYDTAREDMNTAWKLLDGVTQRTINSTRYSSITAQQSPFNIGRDDSDRALVGCTFSCMKTLSTA
jgi:hypothetical protein